MATLTGQTIASSYEQLLHVDTDGGGNTTTLVPVKDGDNGTTFAMQLSTTTICIDNPTADSSTQGGILRLQSDDGALMQSGSRLGVIEFGGAEDSSNTITVGARIEAVTDALWAADENGADMVFYTTDGNAAQSEHLRIKSGSAVNLVITGGSTHSQVDFAGSDGTKDGSIYAEATNIGFLDDDGNWAVRAETDVQTSLYVNNSIKLLVDANSRISLGNNDISAVTSTTIFGYLAGQDIESGATHNTYFGSLAGSENTTGDNNTYIGANSGLGVNGNANNGNTGIGKNTLTAVTTGGSNVCVGVNAGDSITTANHSIFIGSSAGDSLTVTGGGNAYDGQIGIGTSALAALTSGIGNVAVGYQAMDANQTSDYNTAVGTSALGALTNDGDTGNTAVGYNAGAAVTSGVNNTLIGTVVGDGFDAERDNTFVGYASGTGAINGADYCVAIGSSSFQGAATQDGTVAIGYQSLTALTTGAGNTAVGYQALKACTDNSYNTAVGYAAADAIPSGALANTAVGYDALGAGNNATTDNNTCFGFEAGNVITSGSQNTIIGSTTDPSANTGTNQTVIGYNTTGQGDDTVTLGNASVINVFASQDGGARVHCAGIAFAGTQIASADVNTLDDYEEGLDTVAIAAGSGTITIHSSNDQISYTKIGRVVHITGRLNVSAISSPSGDLSITGLPFAAADTTETSELGAGGVYLDNANGAITTYAICFVSTGTTTLILREAGGTGNGADLAAHIDTDTKINIEITYFTT